MNIVFSINRKDYLSDTLNKKAGRMLRFSIGDECHKKTIIVLRTPDLWSGNFTRKTFTTPFIRKARSSATGTHFTYQKQVAATIYKFKGRVC
jgi:hypothetical protein